MAHHVKPRSCPETAPVAACVNAMFHPLKYNAHKVHTQWSVASCCPLLSHRTATRHAMHRRSTSLECGIQFRARYNGYASLNFLRSRCKCWRSLVAAHTETDALARLSKAPVDSGLVATVAEDSVLDLACGHRRFSHFRCL